MEYDCWCQPIFAFLHSILDRALNRPRSVPQDMIAMLKAGVAISEQGDAGVPGAVGPVSLPA